MTLALLCPAPLAALAQESTSATDDDGDFSKRIAACTRCHGDDGAGAMFGDTYYPRLANQSQAYLLKQLRDFRAGRRKNEVMQRIIERLPDAYLKRMAAYFSDQDPAFVTRSDPSGEPTDGQSTNADRALLQRGRILATRGKPSAEVPACTTCHGPDLMGENRPGSLLAPRIVAQHEMYTSSQFEAWLAGTRHNDPAGVMRGVVRRLSAKDRSALAAYLSRTEAGAVERATTDYAYFIANRPQNREREPADPEQIERGAYLVKAGDCRACHTAAGGKPFAGDRPLHTPFGTIYTPNLTPDEETGIGNYSADDFYRVMHQGEQPDGTLLYPAFPFTSYTHITRADSDAIHAFLNSLDPVRNARRGNTFSWPFSMRSTLYGWRMLYFDPGTFEPDTDRSEQWNRGAYLVEGLGHCGSCHTPRNNFGARILDRRLTGAMLSDGWYAPNITADKEHGIGDWSVSQITSLLKTGRADGKGHAIGSMSEVVHNSTQNLSAEDLQSIATYLKTVEAQSLTHDESQPAAKSEIMTRGGEIYADQCSDCHGDDGQGNPPDYPALAGNSTLAQDSPRNTIRIISQGGFGVATEDDTEPHSMPPFAGQQLTPEEIAAVTTYIRGRWADRPARITAQTVEQAQ